MKLPTIRVSHFFIPSFALQAEHRLGVLKTGETTDQGPLELSKAIVRLDLSHAVEHEKTTDNQPPGF